MTQREEGEKKGCRARMVTWVQVEGKVWRSILGKRSIYVGVNMPGGFGAWKHVRLSQKYPVKSPKEGTWDSRDPSNSPAVAQQTHSCLPCHTGEQASTPAPPCGRWLHSSDNF